MAKKKDHAKELEDFMKENNITLEILQEEQQVDYVDKSPKSVFQKIMESINKNKKKDKP